MKERLLLILEKKGLTSAQFADMIGVQRSSISHILSGRNKPSYDFLVKILERYNDINAQWLITGSGNMENTVNAPVTPTKEHNLFSTPTHETKSPNIQRDNKEKTQLITNASEEKIAQSIVDTNVNPGKMTNVNPIKSIIFIYNDNTFEIINKK